MPVSAHGAGLAAFVDGGETHDRHDVAIGGVHRNVWRARETAAVQMAERGRALDYLALLKKIVAANLDRTIRLVVRALGVDYEIVVAVAAEHIVEYAVVAKVKGRLRVKHQLVYTALRYLAAVFAHEIVSRPFVRAPLRLVHFVFRPEAADEHWIEVEHTQLGARHLALDELITPVGN